MSRVTQATPARRPYAPRLPADARRTQLLDAALDLVLERGFAGVTVEAVARAAGVTRPVVYGQFADTAELLGALIERAERTAVEQLAPALPAVPEGEDVDPDELLVAGLVAYLSAVAADPRTWRVVLLPPEGAPPALRERVAAQHRLVLQHLSGLVGWGLTARGTPDIDAELLARSVLVLAEGAAQLVLHDPRRWPVERFAEFARSVLQGLSPVHTAHDVPRVPEV